MDEYDEMTTNLEYDENREPTIQNVFDKDDCIGTNFCIYGSNYEYFFDYFDIKGD